MPDDDQDDDGYERIYYRTRGVPIRFPCMTKEDEAHVFEMIRGLPGIGIVYPKPEERPKNA